MPSPAVSVHASQLPFEVIIPDHTEDRQAAFAVAAKRNAWREMFEKQDVDGMMSLYAPAVARKINKAHAYMVS